ncbi:MAG: 4-alpha-glucanotransferase [Candidatus Omnitrophota bacterium]|nr:MAG: 4-alpha-glucanotransferase [Candidatus Omnitrophota bacterium]
MKFQRSSGVLLHPTSFPGRFGIGDFGAGAYQFIDFLAAAEQSLWQVLPLGPTGYGDSPYQCFSAFAGNPLLIDLEELARDGFLSSDDLQEAPPFEKDKVDYGKVIPAKYFLLKKAFMNFRNHALPPQKEEFEKYSWESGWWLHDFAVFMALKNAHDGAVWSEWETETVQRHQDALAGWTQKLSLEIESQKYWQFVFFKQWRALKQYCNDKGIQIIGDIPIYVAHDSVDTWSNQDLFKFGEMGRPTVVAGVPPDYFSKTGQLWGNPIYRWDAIAQRDFQWWIARFHEIFRLVDIVRIDHFRGFEAFWEVPAREKTAINGRWVQGPGAALFETLERALGELPIIAENLGLITPEVEELRKRFEFPGMAILQFAFGSDAENPYLPHNYEQNLVAYTGTHDNDTTVGWWNNCGEGSTQSTAQIKKEREHVKRYLATDGQEIHWDLIRLLLASTADTAIIPLQDVLGLGTEARMNLPGRPGGNWQWRYSPEMLTDEAGERLKNLSQIYGRVSNASSRH